MTLCATPRYSLTHSDNRNVSSDPPRYALPEKGGDAAWLAGRAYLCLLDLPGASAYGVFNGTIFRSVLALMKKVMEAGGGAGALNAEGKGAGEEARLVGSWSARSAP